MVVCPLRGEGRRRGPDHEFAQRDLPKAEDTGRKQRIYTVTAVILPDETGDSNGLLDRLPSALEAYGPGQYIAPWGAEIQGVARTYSVAESVESLGVAEVSITFHESGEEKYPSARSPSVSRRSDYASAIQA